MQAHVTLRAPDGRIYQLSHGDLVGRIWTAALCLRDPQVSEAHAMVSLRGSSLKLLALRGLFALGGEPKRELVLAPGQQIYFTRTLSVEILNVILPDKVLAIEAEGLPLSPLSGVCSLMPGPSLRPGTHEDALAVFFESDEQWQVRTAQGIEEVQAGWTRTLGAHTVKLSWQSLSTAGNATIAEGRVQAPMDITCRFDAVTIHRAGHPSVRIAGRAARLISELAAVGEPLQWEALAREIWTEDIDAHMLRKRFDTVLGRLREKLRSVGIRANLVRSDHSGLFELVLRPEDTLTDAS